MDRSFGSWMRVAREKQGLTIQQCAQQAGVTWQIWQRMERGERTRSDGSPSRPRRETVLKIADALQESHESALQAAGYPNSATSPTPVKTAAAAAEVWIPDVQALYNELDANDQEDLLQLALVKWQRKHARRLPPSLASMPPEASALAGEFVCLNVQTGRLVFADAVEPAPTHQEPDRHILDVLLRCLTWQDEGMDAQEEITRDLAEIKTLLGV